MTTQNDQPADGAAAGTGQAAPATSQQPAIDWESTANPYKEYKTRFTGLQGKLQQVTNEFDATKLKLGDLDEKHTKLTGDFEVKRAELDTLTAKHAQATADSAALQAKYERLQTVMLKFPDLLPFMSDGKDSPDLLPTGKGEDLEKSLTAFREVIKKQGAATAKELVQGSTSGAGGAGTSAATKQTKEDLLRLAIKAQREGKLDEYDHYYGEFLKAE